MATSNSYSLWIGDFKVASAKAEALKIQRKDREMFQYYYRRGNRYFFRNEKNKIEMQSSEVDKMTLKRGELYSIEYSW